MTFDGKGNLWIADVRGEGVQQFTTSGSATSFLPVHDPKTGEPAHLGCIAFDSHGDLYAWASFGVNQLWEFSPEGNLIRTIGRYGSGPGQLNSVDDVAIGKDGTVYVADQGNHRVAEFSPDGKWLGVLGSGKTGNGEGDIANPTDVAVDRQGDIVVADAGNNRIERFSSSGAFLSQWPITTGPANQYFIAVGPDESVYVIDDLDSELAKYSPFGKLMWNATETAKSVDPLSIAVGPKGTIFVVNRILIWNISSTGAASFWFRAPGTAVAQLSQPWGVEVDPAGGVYVADTSDSSGVRLSSSDQPSAWQS